MEQCQDINRGGFWSPFFFPLCSSPRVTSLKHSHTSAYCQSSVKVYFFFSFPAPGSGKFRQCCIDKISFFLYQFWKIAKYKMPRYRTHVQAVPVKLCRQKAGIQRQAQRCSHGDELTTIRWVWLLRVSRCRLVAEDRPDQTAQDSERRPTQTRRKTARLLIQNRTTVRGRGRSFHPLSKQENACLYSSQSKTVKSTSVVNSDRCHQWNVFIILQKKKKNSTTIWIELTRGLHLHLDHF